MRWWTSRLNHELAASADAADVKRSLRGSSRDAPRALVPTHSPDSGVSVTASAEAVGSWMRRRVHHRIMSAQPLKARKPAYRPLRRVPALGCALGETARRASARGGRLAATVVPSRRRLRRFTSVCRYQHFGMSLWHALLAWGVSLLLWLHSSQERIACRVYAESLRRNGHVSGHHRVTCAAIRDSIACIAHTRTCPVLRILDT